MLFMFFDYEIIEKIFFEIQNLKKILTWRRADFLDDLTVLEHFDIGCKKFVLHHREENFS